MRNKADLEEVIERFKEDLRTGNNPSINDYARQYPQHNETISELFPTIRALEELKQQNELANINKPMAAMKLDRLGEYRITREIGRGGMGVVYQAYQESLHRSVAIKVLPWLDKADQTGLRRFQREARVAANLEYSHIVPILDLGNEEDIHYYVMRYIDGFGLEEIISYLNQNGISSEFDSGQYSAISDSKLLQKIIEQITTGNSTKLNAEFNNTSPYQLPKQYYLEVAKIFSQLAQALHYAHSQGAIHRDIKPANLLLDRTGVIWISDFGLAKTLSSETLTQTQDILGTLRFMAPERFEGSDDDSRSDIYSLGLCLYEMLTLQSAYNGKSGNLIYKITHAKFKAPHDLNQAIPARLENIVLKAISLEPNQRYQNAQEMEKELNDFIQQFIGSSSYPITTSKNTGNISAKRLPKQDLYAKNRDNPLKKTASYLVLLLIGLTMGYFFIDRDINQTETTLSKPNSSSINQKQGERNTAVKNPEPEQLAPNPAIPLSQQSEPPPPPGTEARPRDFEQRDRPLAKHQRTKIIEILSAYNPDTLTAQEARAINNAFRAAGIRRGPGQLEAVQAAGFDPETIRRLDPPPDRPPPREPPPR